jgi:hypothetical protein
MSWSQIDSTKLSDRSVTALAKAVCVGQDASLLTLSEDSISRNNTMLGRFSVRLGELSVVKMLVNILRHTLHPLDWACSNAPTVLVV